MIPVVEIFGPTLQGEGLLAGKRTMFVRTGYCDGAGDQWCNWCDSLFAVDPRFKEQWTMMEPKDILDQLDLLADYCGEVTISGGNPLIHDLSDLCSLLQSAYYRIHVETQGTIWREWLRSCATVTVSPKPPSAGKCNRDRLSDFLDRLRGLRPDTDLVCKVVVDPDSEGDYEFARDVFTEWRRRIGTNHMYLSCLTRPDDDREALLNRYRQLADRACTDAGLPDVGVLPQMHVLTWGHGRGV